MGRNILILMVFAILLPILYMIYLQITSPSPPTTSTSTLKDKKASVIKDITPMDISGKVKVMNGRNTWSAISEEEIEKGAKVNISEVEGVHLKVEELEDFLKKLEEDVGKKEACPNCGSGLPIDSEVCPVCGEELKVTEEEEEKEEEEKIEEQAFCPNCKSVIPTDTETCPECGEELEGYEEEEVYFEELEELEDLVEDFEK